MGTKNSSGIRKVVRGGKPLWIIDFRFTNKSGSRQRCRRDASVQNYSASLAEAARLMRKAAATGCVEDEPETTPACLTYRAFVEGPFKAEHMPGFRPATRVRYDALHRQSLMAFFGDKPLDAITTGDIRAYAATLQTRKLQTKGPVTLVRTVLRAAKESGHLDVLPEVPRGLAKTSRKLPDAPSAQEFAVMLEAPGWLGLSIALAGLAGLRMGEVRALEVRDVDLEGGRLLVRRALSEDVSLTTKDNEERVVPLLAELAERLRVAVRSKLPKVRVVLDDDGETPRRQETLRRLKHYLRLRGLRERSFHSLRHYFVSELVRRGAGLEAVRALAGHSSLEMTQRYAHATGADLRAAVDRLGE